MTPRSLLFAPGDDERKLAKLPGTGADAVVLDLEDAVSASRKSVARSTIRDFLDTVGPGAPEMWVRIGHAEVEAARPDLEAADHPALTGLVAPKVESRQAMWDLDAFLAGTEHLAHAAVLPQIETARGLLAAETLDAWPERVRTLSYGSVDFARDCGVEFEPDHPLLEHVRRRLVVAARAAGLQPPIDGPFMRVADVDGLAADCEHGRRLGYGGKTLIHPGQVGVTNDAFSYLSPARREHLERVVAAYEAEADRSALVVDGVFVDEPVYRAALDALGVTGTR